MRIESLVLNLDLNLVKRCLKCAQLIKTYVIFCKSPDNLMVKSSHRGELVAKSRFHCHFIFVSTTKPIPNIHLQMEERVVLLSQL